MKTRLLKKLRTQAKKKYMLEVNQINDKLVNYRVIMNDTNSSSKVLYQYDHINQAITMRNKLRRNDIMKNLEIIRYHRVLKKFK